MWLHQCSVCISWFVCTYVCCLILCMCIMCLCVYGGGGTNVVFSYCPYQSRQLMEISQLRPLHPHSPHYSHYHRPHLINTAVWRISIEMPNSRPLCYHRHKPTSYQQWSSPIPKQAWRYNHNMRWHHVSAAGLWMNLYLQHVARTACEWFLLTLDCLFV